MAGWLVGWLVGCLVVWLFGCLVGCLVGWLVGWHQSGSEQGLFGWENGHLSLFRFKKVYVIFIQRKVLSKGKFHFNANSFQRQISPNGKFHPKANYV